jgi:hypothetical protein
LRKRRSFSRARRAREGHLWKQAGVVTGDELLEALKNVQY